MIGLTLEGGGARGAYHIGVIKALIERGYDFDGYAGTSIGAINSAVLAQGDYLLAVELWEQITMDHIFDIDEKVIFELDGLSKLWADVQLPKKIARAARKIIEGKGISTDRIKEFLGTYIDEDRVRASNKDFGLVTVSVSEGKPYVLTLDDIPQGSLINYVMASASLPGFRPEVIGGSVFIDGGLYDNCPVNILLKKDYEHVFAVRTNTPGIIRKAFDPERVTYISPSEDLGNIMWFSPENSKRNIALGYKDGMDISI